MAAFSYRAVFMLSKPYDFRQFQAELAAIDAGQPASSPPTGPQPSGTRLERARAEFLALREHYHLGVADVVAFFPEEEGIAYLQALIAAAEAKPSRRRRKAG